MNDMRVIKDFNTHLDIESVDQVVSLADHTPEVEFFKRGFARHYKIDDLELTEHVILYPEKSSVVVHYQWNDAGVRQLFADHRSDFAFAYPYNGAMMSLVYVWSQELNATVVRSEDKNFASIVGANAPARVTTCGRYDKISYADWRVRGDWTPMCQVGSSMLCTVMGINSVDIVISGTTSGIDALLYDYAHALRYPKEALEKIAK